ncbi:MAG: hypothetical protein ACKPKO_06540, partial [Candidatus Fonsibacter sp.]
REPQLAKVTHDVPCKGLAVGFTNYLDSHDDPSVWSAPRLIVQLDSLMNIFTRSDDISNGEGFKLRYDMLILDESESRLAHFDGRVCSGRRSTSGTYLTTF